MSTGIKSIGSLRLRKLVEQLEANAEHALEAFWQEMAELGTPIVEPADDDPTDCLTTFVWREESPVTGLSLVEPFSYKSPESRRLTKLPDTDIWYLSWHIRSTLRGSYSFKLTTPDDEETQVHDPRNHYLQPSDWQYVSERHELELTATLVLPEARELPWLDERPEVPKGSVTAFPFDSSILGNSRTLWVYTPAGYARDQGPYHYIINFDGQPYHSSPTVLDNLIAAGEVPPVVSILVDQIGIRNEELTCNPAFSRMLVEELVPWARETFNLTDEAAKTVITGRSFGGLCSAYTALKHPDIFGNVFMQSGSCWYEPAALAAFQADPRPEIVGDTYATPVLITEYLKTDPVPIRIYQEVGSQELGPPPAHPHQIYANRHFRDVALAKGYDLHYTEFNGGHDDAWWRGTLADGLIHLIGVQ